MAFAPGNAARAGRAVFEQQTLYAVLTLFCHEVQCLGGV